MNPPPRTPVDRVVILVCTYRRPEGLKRLLESLAEHQTRLSFDVVVVDNDPATSGRHVTEASELPVKYLVEERPGIAAARNRTLQEIRRDHDAVVFVDDDEFVEEGWLDAHVEALDAWDADVVTGPVISLLPEDAPRWVRRGGFIQRSPRATGTSLSSAKTSNTIVRGGWLGPSSDIVFDEAFSRSGGSDTDLFWRLRRLGATIVWSADAVVSEPVPRSRTTARWIVRRDFRGGVVMGRIMLRDSPRSVVLAKGVARTLAGAVRTVLGTIVHLGPRASDVKVLLFGSGVVSACFGVLTDEYGRGPDVGALGGAA